MHKMFSKKIMLWALLVCVALLATVSVAQGAKNAIVHKSRDFQYDSFKVFSLRINPYDETTHEHLIKAMVALGEYSLAANQYKYLKKLLYEQYGAAPSPRLTEMYELTIKPRNDMHRNLDVILGDLWEDELTSGGYFCEYEIFRYIFRLYCRENARAKKELPLLLLSLSDKDSTEPQSKKLTKAMVKLSDCISKSLRKRDIYTRYSHSQYILLLPATPIDDVSVVKERISAKFLKYKEKQFHISPCFSHYF